MTVAKSNFIKKCIKNEQLFSELDHASQSSIEKSIYRDYLKILNRVQKEFPNVESTEFVLQIIKHYLLKNFNISTDFTEHAVCQGEMINACESKAVKYVPITPFKLLIDTNSVNQLEASWKAELIKSEKVMRSMEKNGITATLRKYKNNIENLTHNINQLSEAKLNGNAFVEIYMPTVSDYSKVSVLERHILGATSIDTSQGKNNNTVQFNRIKLNLAKENKFIQSGIKSISELNPKMVDFDYLVTHGLKPKGLEKEIADIIKNKILAGSFELLIDKIIIDGNLTTLSSPLTDQQIVYGKKLMGAISALQKAPQEVREQINNKIKAKINSDGLGSYIKEDYERKLASLSNEHDLSITSTGLTKLENQAITLIDDSRDRLLTELEKSIVINFIEKTLGNKNRNSRLRKSLGKNVDTLFRIKHEEAIEQLAYLSHKIKKNYDYQLLTDKINVALDKISKNEALTHDEQISIEDFGYLTNLAKVNKYLMQLDRSGVISSSEKLLHLYKNSEQALGFIEQINNAFKKDQQYEDGDILMYNSSKENLYKMKKNDTEAFLRNTLISQYGHAAQIFFDDQGIARVSHIYGTYQRNELSFAEAMHSDIFRFDPISLLSQAACDAAINKWGNAWKEAVREIYRQSQSKLHNESEDMFDEIRNSRDARFASGKADFIPFGHSKTEQNDFELLRDQMYRNGDKSIDTKIMICSEFVTKTTIASLVETNDLLKNLIGIDNSLQIPFSKHEDLQKVHTGRLIKKLMQSGALTKIRRPKIENFLIKESETSYTNSIIRMSQIIESELRNIPLDERQHVSTNKKKQLIKNIITYVKDVHNKYNPNDKMLINDEIIDQIFYKMSSSIDILIDKTVAHNDQQLRKNYIVRCAETILSTIKNFFSYHTNLTKSLEKDLSSLKSTIIYEGLSLADRKQALANSTLAQQSKHDAIHGLFKASVQAVEYLIASKNSNNSKGKKEEFEMDLQKHAGLIEQCMRNLQHTMHNDNQSDLKNIQELLDISATINKLLITPNSNDVTANKKSFFLTYHKQIILSAIDENLIQEILKKLDNFKF